MTPLEKAARAVDPAAFEGDEPYHREFREKAFADARAVLTAIREPGVGLTYTGNMAEMEGAEADGVWIAMIDHILEGGE